MSVVLVGKAPSANILFTDAMVTMKDDTNSFMDCKLKDKIVKLSTSSTYLSILGDENVLYGIQAIDHWASEKSITLDYTDRKTIEDALVAAEKFIKVFKIKNGDTQPQTDGATIYFISHNDVYEYKVSRQNDKYSITSFRLFKDNEVLLNYAGAVENIVFHETLDNYSNKAINIIKQVHESRKQHSQKSGIRCHLKYDFDNRFCGIILADGEVKEVILPFRNLSDLIASQTGNWDLIFDPTFAWSPF